MLEENGILEDGGLLEDEASTQEPEALHEGTEPNESAGPNERSERDCDHISEDEHDGLSELASDMEKRSDGEHEDAQESLQDGARDGIEDGEEYDELTLLRRELERLRAELRSRDELDRANARIKRELEEFEEYFPQTDPSEISEEIWERVRGGGSLASEYALHLRKGELEKQRALDFNKKNRRMSSGSLENGEGEKYLSPSEVRAMTPKQVKQNYDVIMESMRHWN